MPRRTADWPDSPTSRVRVGRWLVAGALLVAVGAIPSAAAAAVASVNPLRYVGWVMGGIVGLAVLALLVGRMRGSWRASAALVLSAFLTFYLLVSGGFGTNPNPSFLPLGGLFFVLAVAMLVGTVLILGGSAWGAVLIALWAAGMLVWVLLRENGPFPGTELVLAVATVLAIAVAIGTAPRQGPPG